MFQRQTVMIYDGVDWQEMQAYMLSDKETQCTQALPRVRTPVAGSGNRIICGCCMGEDCECCHFTGYIN